MFNTNLTAINIEYDTPIKTGRRFKVGNVWKDEYIYYKNIGVLPNSATSKTVDTSISQSSITMVTGTGGIAVNASGTPITLNCARPMSNSSAIALQVIYNDNKLAFYAETGGDRSTWTAHCWVTYY